VAENQNRVDVSHEIIAALIGLAGTLAAAVIAVRARMLEKIDADLEQKKLRAFCRISRVSSG
jgi:hypothetical protein